MDTRITMSNLPAFGVVSGSEAEDGAAETSGSAAPVCEGSEGIPLPGGKPGAVARRETGVISSSGNRNSKENTNYREANKTITPPRGRNADPSATPPAGAAPGGPRSGLHGLKAAKGAGLGSRTQYCPLPGRGDEGRQGATQTPRHGFPPFSSGGGSAQARPLPRREAPGSRGVSSPPPPRASGGSASFRRCRSAGHGSGSGHGDGGGRSSAVNSSSSGGGGGAGGTQLCGGVFGAFGDLLILLAMSLFSQANFEEDSQNQPAVGHWKTLMPSKGSKEEPETGCQDARGVDETQSTEQLNMSRLRSSSVEIREKGSEFLKEELHKAQKELKLKDKECERLSKVREQLEQELEELTASLFEEAHKMVREANTKQAASEKQLREARGKIDMLQAEVTALKTLVITSTPSSPNRELHPQLQSPSKAVFRKGHGRNKSTSSAMVSAASQNVTPEPVSHECKEVDSILFAEFQAWKESPTLDKSCSFLDRIYREDVGPCLDFTKQELSELVRVAVEQNTLTIEPVASQTLPVVKVSAEECGGPNGFRSQIVTKCALSGLPRTCKHRIMLGDSGNYYYISPSCRARITAVCNFFTYIRYIQQGLVRQDVELMYWEIMRLRREMSLAKLGFYPSEM